MNITDDERKLIIDALESYEMNMDFTMLPQSVEYLMELETTKEAVKKLLFKLRGKND